MKDTYVPELYLYKPQEYVLAWVKLGIAPNATEDDIKRAFKTKLLANHNLDIPESEKEANLKKLNIARDTALNALENRSLLPVRQAQTIYQAGIARLNTNTSTATTDATIDTKVDGKAFATNTAELTERQVKIVNGILKGISISAGLVQAGFYWGAVQIFAPMATKMISSIPGLHTLPIYLTPAAASVLLLMSKIHAHSQKKPTPRSLSFIFGLTAMTLCLSATHLPKETGFNELRFELGKAAGCQTPDKKIPDAVCRVLTPQ